MWNNVVALSGDKNQVIALLPKGYKESINLAVSGLAEVLTQLNVSSYALDDDAVQRFLKAAKNGQAEAYKGVLIAERKDASIEIIVSEQDMLATAYITGAHGGKSLQGSDFVQALIHAGVTKGISKLALKKALMMSRQLKPGENYSQPVAQGKQAIPGKDSECVALVEDVLKRVLAPRKTEEINKVDMRDLGETVTVGANEPVMRRHPATEGAAGFTVLGKILVAKPGKNNPMLAGKGTHISPEDPDLLLSSQAGMPIIRSQTVDIEDALCLNHVSIATGHVKFKGNLYIAGDIEPGMVVRATGSIKVGGFIESADVQAKGDIEIGKGIIGHPETDDGKISCIVKSGGRITANYAQYSELQAGENIHIAVHSMGNDLRCGGDLIIKDAAERQGTLSGGNAKVGGRVECINLGVEGDTATYIEVFARYAWYKERVSQLKTKYKFTQEETMSVIRRELEFAKRPKEKRTAEEAAEIEAKKAQANKALEAAKGALEQLNEEFDSLLKMNTVEVKEKVFTHVTLQYDSERVTTKRTHGPSTFSFNHYEIQRTSRLNKDDIGKGADI